MKIKNIAAQDVLMQIKSLQGEETTTTSSYSLDDWRDWSLTFSPLLSYSMKHTHTSQKATIARWWERDGWILASLPTLGVLFIVKIKD
jgi:hypothetical protein